MKLLAVALSFALAATAATIPAKALSNAADALEVRGTCDTPDGTDPNTDCGPPFNRCNACLVGIKMCQDHEHLSREDCEKKACKALKVVCGGCSFLDCPREANVDEVPAVTTGDTDVVARDATNVDEIITARDVAPAGVNVADVIEARVACDDAVNGTEDNINERDMSILPRKEDISAPPPTPCMICWFMVHSCQNRNDLSEDYCKLEACDKYPKKCQGCDGMGCSPI